MVSMTRARSHMGSGWGVVVASAIALITGQGAINVFGAGVFLTPVSAALGFGRGDVSVAIGLSNLLTAVSMPIFGRLVDRYGVRVPLLTSIALFGLATAMFALLQASTPMLFCLYAFSGIVGVGHNAGPYSLVVSSWFDRRRGAALGLTLAGVGLGTLIVPRLSGFLVGALGWRLAYVGLGVCVVLISFIPVFFFLKSPIDNEKKRRGSGQIMGFSVSEACRTRQFLAMAIAFFIVGFSINGVLIHVVPMLTDRGLPLKVAASVVSVSGVTLIAGRLAVGYLMDKISADKLGAIFLILPAAGIILLLFPHISPVLAVALLGAGIGAEVDLLSFYVSRYFGMKAFGTLHGLLFSIAVLGNAAGASALGMLFLSSGSYGIALKVCSGLLLIAIFLLASLGRYRFPAVEHDH